MSLSESKISTFVINLKSRVDRRAHIDFQFFGKQEFKMTFVDAIQHEVGIVGLWKTMKYILTDLVNPSDEYILICQDDHQFTEFYSYDILMQSINEAISKDADILLGGVSWFQTCLKFRGSLYWIEKFSGLQFAVVFRSFFATMLNADLDGWNACDYRLSDLTNKKWVIYPFISVQKDFGYSDVTLKNNLPERQQQLFENSSQTVNTLENVAHFFRARKVNAAHVHNAAYYEKISIRTFIINLAERKDRLKHIKKQFENREEFDVSIIAGIRDEIGALGLWRTIREIVSCALQDGEDIIIICEDDHSFTKYYSKYVFLKSVLAAHYLGADLVVGGPSGGVEHIMPVSDNLCWINAFFGAQFIVLYKKIFPVILNEPFDKTVKADNMLSEIAVNKLSFYPFISIQEDFGYSDINSHIRANRPICDIFENSEKRFARVLENFSIYTENPGIN